VLRGRLGVSFRIAEPGRVRVSLLQRAGGRLLVRARAVRVVPAGTRRVLVGRRDPARGRFLVSVRILGPVAGPRRISAARIVRG
jgi:hypothetical protein